MSLHIRPDGKHATDEFGTLLFALAETLGKRFTAAQIVSYARILGDVPLAEVAQACQLAMREGNSWLPSPGDLMRYVRPSADEAALIAWAGLTQAASAVGAYAPLAVEDPAVASAVRTVFGGWPAFCAECGANNDWVQRRSEFIASFKQARRTLSQSGEVLLLGFVDEPEDGMVGRLAATGELGEIDVTRLTGRRITDGEATEGGKGREPGSLPAHGGGRGADQPAADHGPGDR